MLTHLLTVGNRPVFQEKTLVFKAQHYESDKILTDKVSQHSLHIKYFRTGHSPLLEWTSFLWLMKMWRYMYIQYVPTYIPTHTQTHTHTYMHIIQTCMHIHSHTHTKMSIQAQIHWYLKNEVKKPNYIDTIQISVNNWASFLLDLLVLLWPGYAYSTSCWFNWLSPLSPSPVHNYLKYVSPGIINLQDWCGCWASISVTWSFCLFVCVCVCGVS